jgi:hypothetical protein
MTAIPADIARRSISRVYTLSGATALGDRGPSALSSAPMVAVASSRRNDAALRLVAWLALLAPLVCALGISFVVTPADIESGRVALSPPCMMRQALGVECPACGLTRAFAALAHGRVAQAFHFNHAAPLAYVAAWALAVCAVAGAARAIGDAVRRRLA